MRHLSKRSMKLIITFTSSSCNLADTGGMRRVLRSREGLETCTCLTTSYGFTNKMVAFSQLRGEREETYRAGHPILINADECAHFIEVHVSKLGLFDHLGIEPASKFHHQQQHMVIGSARKEDLSCIQLVKGATYRPNIDGGVIRRSEDYKCMLSVKSDIAGKCQLTDFWSSVEPADQVGRDIVLRSIGCRTEITQFEYGLLFVYLKRKNDKPENK